MGFIFAFVFSIQDCIFIFFKSITKVVKMVIRAGFMYISRSINEGLNFTYLLFENQKKNEETGLHLSSDFFFFLIYGQSKSMFRAGFKFLRYQIFVFCFFGLEMFFLSGFLFVM